MFKIANNMRFEDNELPTNKWVAKLQFFWRNPV